MKLPVSTEHGAGSAREPGSTPEPGSTREPGPTPEVSQTPVARAEPERTAAPAAPAARRGLSFHTIGLDRFSGLYVLVFLIVLFSILLPDTFPTSQTLRGVANDYAITAILAFALIIPLAAGVFDLSVAGQLGFTVTVVAYLQAQGWPAILSIIAALAIGAGIGAFNGTVVVRLRVNSFIATLGMSSVLAAGAYWVTGGQAIISGFSKTYLKAGTNELLSIPLPVWYLVVIAAILWYVLEQRPVGRYLYATGGSPEAARLAGVRTDRIVFGSLVASGFLAALAGVILTAKIGIGDPNVGPPYLLPAFSAAFLGATQIKNGRVNVLGTLVAVYLLAVGVKGLQLSGAALYVTDLFNGTALIVAVALAANTARKR